MNILVKLQTATAVVETTDADSADHLQRSSHPSGAGANGQEEIQLQFHELNWLYISQSVDKASVLPVVRRSFQSACR